MVLVYSGIYANIIWGYIDGIHGAPWIRHGISIYIYIYYIIYISLISIIWLDNNDLYYRLCFGSVFLAPGSGSHL